MVRQVRTDDIDAILNLSKLLNMFDPEGIELIKNTLEDYCSGNSDQLWFAIGEHTALEGVIYCSPEEMTNGTWNILMLLIDPAYHGRGNGQALMKHVEGILTDKQQRLLIVETSGLDDFERARDFYPRCGYKEEARIQNFYDQGDDKIVFTKQIN